MNNYMIPDKRGEAKAPPKDKFDFKCFKHDVCCSLNDVEYFLNNLSCAYKYVWLIKLLK